MVLDTSYSSIGYGTIPEYYKEGKVDTLSHEVKMKLKSRLKMKDESNVLPDEAVEEVADIMLDKLTTKLADMAEDIFYGRE